MVLGLRANLLRDVRIEVAELVGDLVVAGTATAATAGTLTDTNRLRFANNSEIKGFWVYIWGGTGIGQERRVTGFTASSNQLTVDQNWTTTPDTTSTYLITRRFSASQIDRAIDAAISRYAKSCSVPWESHYLGVNNIFNDPEDVGNIQSDGTTLNWQTDLFDTVNTPNQWTMVASNTDFENTTFALGDLRRVLKVTNTAASAATAKLSVGNWRKWIGHQVQGFGLVSAGTASRARLQVDDGAAQYNATAYHTGTDNWQRLTTGWNKLDDNSTKLDFLFRIESGSSITAYFSWAYLQADYPFQQYIIPSPFTVIESINFEMVSFPLTGINQFGRYHLESLDNRLWDVWPGPQLDTRPRSDSGRGQEASNFPRLIFRTDLFNPPTPARILIKGRGFPNLIATTASTVGGPGTTNYENISPVVAPELVKYAAAAQLNERIPAAGRALSTTWLEGEEKRWARQYITRMPFTGRRVRSW